VGRPKELFTMKGDPIPCVVQVVGNILESRFWGCRVRRVDS
jgi:hypothetical protein